MTGAPERCRASEAGARPARRRSLSISAQPTTSSKSKGKKAPNHSFLAANNQVNPRETDRARVIRETRDPGKTDVWQVKTIRDGVTGSKVSNKNTVTAAVIKRKVEG